MQWSYIVLLLFLVVINRRIAYAQLNIDSPCSVKNQTGYCELIHLCPPIYKELDARIRPEFICGFQELVPIICCPYKIIGYAKNYELQKWDNVYKNNNIQTDPSKRPAERMCHVYRKYADENGSVSLAVAGGSKTKNTEFPHMAAIGFIKNKKVNWNCGGTLISDQWVLSAAHCSYNYQWGPAEYIRVGTIRLDQDNNDKMQVRRIVQRIRHPNFKKPSMYYDIALFKMIRTVEINDHVKPACLPIKPNLELNEMATITGWGMVDEHDNRGSAHLLKVEVPIVANETCREHYAKVGSKLPIGYDPKTQLCAGGQNGKDACPGDSGGGLVILNDDYLMYEVIGVTSYGISCGYDVPGIYTKVNYYLDWIEKIVWPDLTSSK